MLRFDFDFGFCFWYLVLLLFLFCSAANERVLSAVAEHFKRNHLNGPTWQAALRRRQASTRAAASVLSKCLSLTVSSSIMIHRYAESSTRRQRSSRSRVNIYIGDIYLTAIECVANASPCCGARS